MEDLLTAVNDTNSFKLKNLLKKHPNLVNSVDISGRSLLIIAVQKKDINSIKLLLATKNINVSLKDDDNLSALDYAILEEDEEIIILLLNAAPTHFSARTDNPKLLRLLNYPSRPIPDRLTSKRLINLLLNIENVFLIPADILLKLKNEFGIETVERFNDFILDICQLEKYFSKISYLNKGAYGHTFELCITNTCDPPLVMKLVPYMKTYAYSKLSVFDPSRPENVEWAILAIINKMFSKFPHVPISYRSFICSNSALSPLRRFLDKFLEKEFSTIDNFRVSFIEYAEEGSLFSFVQKKKNKHHLKHIIFQVVLVMATLLDVIPEFRHNDFHIGNLLIRRNREDIFGKYRDEEYLIEKPEIRVLINDFDFSFIKPDVINAKYDEFNPSVPNPTPYYDMFKFFNALISKIEIDSQSDIHKFIRYVIPYDDLLGHTRYLPDKNPMVRFFGLAVTEKLLKENNFNMDYKARYPKELLKHHFFDNFFTGRRMDVS